MEWLLIGDAYVAVLEDLYLEWKMTFPQLHRERPHFSSSMNIYFKLMWNYAQISHNLLGGVDAYSGEHPITLLELLSMREWKQFTAITVMIFCKFTHEDSASCFKGWI